MSVTEINSIEDLKAFFLSSGGTEAEFNQQIQQLNVLIQQKIVQDLLTTKPSGVPLETDEQKLAHIKEHFSTEEITHVAEQASSEIMAGYIRAITQ